MLNKTEKRLLDALLPHAEKNGIEIITIEIIGSKKNPTVRVYIDKMSKPTNNAKLPTEITKELSASNVAINNTADTTVDVVSAAPLATTAPPTTTTTASLPTKAPLATKASSISFDELASSQAWISSVLDEIDPFSGSYTLEVSSPGIDRPLRTPDHFNAYAGSEATIKLKGRINNASTLKGQIARADDASVTVVVDGEQIVVPFAEIKRANLKGVVDFSKH